jgi:transglutaminase-like putative cysteine protease
MSSHRLTFAAAIATLLAAISLYPLFIGIAWWWAGAGAAVTVAAAGTLTRLRRFPVLVCLAVGVAALIFYLNLVFEGSLSYGHLLPTLNSLDHLARLTHEGMDDSAKYAPPAPELPGLLLLASGGIGIVALLTDLTAVRLRSVALAGLPLLLLVTEPFAVSASRSWVGTVIAFCLGSAGYLGILGTETRQRIREWEQPRPGVRIGPDTSALTAAGRRVGLTSLVVALCLPLFIPGLHTTRLLGGQPGIGGIPGSGGGGGLPGFPSPETAVSQELQNSKPQPVLQYRTLGASTTVPEYLQLYALDDLTPSGWQLASGPAHPHVNGALPPPPGLPYTYVAVPDGSSAGIDVPTVTTEIQIAPNVSANAAVNGKPASVLPVPYPALKVAVPSGTWQASTTDLMVYSDDTQVTGLHYSVESANLLPPAQDLEVAGPAQVDIAQSYTTLPASYRSLTALKTFAQNITAGKSTDFDKAIALQAWLADSGAFAYTLKAPSITTAAQLQTFLASSRKGYCQQFAVAMAVLARFLGIPARVAVGYTSGTRARDGSWSVTTHDAHEWPELYFSGYGWLRFEPTPTGAAGGQGSATAPAYTQQATASNPGSSSGTTSSGSDAAPHPGATIFPPGAQLPFYTGLGGLGTGPAKRAGGLTPWQIFGLVVAGLLVLAVIAPAVARAAIRRRRWGHAARGGDADLAHAAWQELQDDLVDYQAGYSPSETPRAVGSRLRSQLDEGAAVAALERITTAVERARYAGSPLPGGRLRQDSAEFRRALAATMPRRTRWRARLLPLSVLTPTATGVSQAADAVGGFSPGWLRPGKRR